MTSTFDKSVEDLNKAENFAHLIPLSYLITLFNNDYNCVDLLTNMQFQETSIPKHRLMIEITRHGISRLSTEKDVPCCIDALLIFQHYTLLNHENSLITGIPYHPESIYRMSQVIMACNTNDDVSQSFKDVIIKQLNLPESDRSIVLKKMEGYLDPVVGGALGHTASNFMGGSVGASASGIFLGLLAKKYSKQLNPRLSGVVKSFGVGMAVTSASKVLSKSGVAHKQRSPKKPAASKKSEEVVHISMDEMFHTGIKRDSALNTIPGTEKTLSSTYTDRVVDAAEKMGESYYDFFTDSFQLGKTAMLDYMLLQISQQTGYNVDSTMLNGFIGGLAITSIIGAVPLAALSLLSVLVKLGISYDSRPIQVMKRKLEFMKDILKEKFHGNGETIIQYLETVQNCQCMNKYVVDFIGMYFKISVKSDPKERLIESYNHMMKMTATSVEELQLQHKPYDLHKFDESCIKRVKGDLQSCDSTGCMALKIGDDGPKAMEVDTVDTTSSTSNRKKKPIAERIGPAINQKVIIVNTRRAGKTAGKKTRNTPRKK